MLPASLASLLEGKTIDKKWHVLEKRIKTLSDSSGAFSSCYKVKNTENDRLGFLKALNYQYAFSATGGKGMSSADFLKEMSSNYVYERDLLRFCEEEKMSRIVTAIDHGEYSEPGAYPVPYLVFEIADATLKNISVIKNPDVVWKLITFHGCLVGLSQLHNKQIAHQDLKPSNVLIFGKNVSKLGDLGNATRLGNSSPLWSGPNHCGDMNFAPIELLYGHYSTDWNTRRFGADLFMAGGIITYLLSGFNFLTLILLNLPDAFTPFKFGGTFAEALPNIMEANNKALAEVAMKIPASIRDDLIAVIAQLCHPVPEDRGNPKGLHRGMAQYSLQRYISIIDRLAKKMHIEKIVRGAR